MSDLEVQAVVLAAGLSTRFKGNKLLAEIEGLPLIVRAVKIALSQEAVSKVIVVTGHMREEIEEAVKRHLHNERGFDKISFVYNPAFRDGGMSSSVKRGLERADRKAHIMVIPGDVACVRESTVARLIDAHLSGGHLISIACYRGKHGHPALFSPELRKELESIEEMGLGLKSVIKRHESEAACVETDDEGTIIDIDTEADLKICESLIKKG